MAESEGSGCERPGHWGMPAQIRGTSPDPEASALMRWYHFLNVRGIGDYDVSGVR